MTTLLIIDMQMGMTWPEPGVRNNPGAEAVMAGLLARWREAGDPVVHVRHLSRSPGSPFWPGQPGVEFQPALAPLPHEHVVDKHVPDAFVHTGLERWLVDQKYNIPAGAAKYLQPYITAGSKFFVAKVDITKVTMKDGMAMMKSMEGGMSGMGGMQGGKGMDGDMAARQQMMEERMDMMESMMQMMMDRMPSALPK